MITKLEINNFRNLAHISLDFTKKTSIISGKNELGKSNSLNALMWALTGMLFTDKWGSGENDIESIIPRNATRGLDPEVSITFDNDSKFTKVFVTSYKSDGKVGGHHAAYYVNGVVKKNSTEFNSLFYEALGFKPSLNVADIKEVNLFVDPLYALQKLDAKTLRRLLVELGCSVTNEEMYKLGFEDLRPYEAKYFGKWDVMRKNLKDEAKGYEKRLEQLSVVLGLTNDCDFNQEELDQVNARKQELVGKLERVKGDNINPEIAKIKQRIEVLKTEIDGLRKTKEIEKRNFEANKEMGINNLNIKLKLKHDEDCKAIEEAITTLIHNMALGDTKINAIKRDIESTKQLITSKQQTSNLNAKQKSDLALRYEEVNNSQYHKIVCPVCGSEIVEDEDDFQKFEADKKKMLAQLTNEIEACIINEENYKAEIQSATKKLDDLTKELETATKTLVASKEQYASLQKQVDSIPYDETILKEIEELKAQEYPATQNAEIEAKVSECDDLNNSLRVFEEQDDAEIFKKIIALQDEIKAQDELAGALYVKRSKFKEREEYLQEQADVVKKLNDTESLLGRVNKFIQTMIKLINEKATEKTGMTFVMLEENLTNDGITEVCYPTIDGVPFKDINTAKKMAYGIKFIDTLKSILGNNNLPILADRMEGIDDIAKIDQLTTSQLICTRVSNSEKMEVL